MRPYVLAFSDRTHFSPNVLPVHSALHRSSDFDSTFIGLKEQTHLG
jgi:hypothetical protein